MERSRDRAMLAVLILLLAALVALLAGPALESRLGIGPEALFAVPLVAVLAILMNLGTLRDRRGPLLRALLVLGNLAFAALLVAIVALDRPEEAAGSRRLLGMLPATALLVVGVWGIPFWFVACYIAFFRGAVSAGGAEETRADEPASSDA